MYKRQGAVGVDVNGADAQGFEKICQFFASQGTTSWLGSVLTDTREQTLTAIGEYKAWKKSEHKDVYKRQIYTRVYAFKIKHFNETREA